jgi:AraC-like DNA-binding protein
VTVGYLRYGAEIDMRPAPLSSCYHINLPVSGHTRSECGNSSIVSSPTCAAVFSPEQPTRVRWSSECAQIAVKLDRGALQAELEAALDRSVSTVRFELGMDVTSTLGRSWAAALELVVAEAERHGSLIHQPLATKQFERMLMTALLFVQPHNHSEALREPAPPARPRSVQRIIDLIDARPEAPYSAGDLAAHAGVSLRSLQAGFRRHVGMSPMSYLNEVRLARVHADLADADPTERTTTETAYRWGFTHLGRFAAAYRKKFGVSPSDTLRRPR